MLRLDHVANAVTIPIEAVVLNGRQQVVYVVDAANHVHVRPVQVGIEGSKLAEIKSGLNAGDRVIVGGQDKYQENQEVSPELETTQASETVQETGGMIDLKGEEDIANEGGPETADQRQSGHQGAATTGTQSGAPDQRTPKHNPGGER
jgi:hypothetical protein